MSNLAFTRPLQVALVQSSLVWQDSEANLKNFTQLLAALNPVDLVVLPEMFNSGFSMQSQRVAERMNGPTIQWMQQQAQRYDLAICGSIAIQVNHGIVNRLVFVYPDGQIDFYDKRHLFRMAGEDQHYVAGQQRKIIEYRGARICLQICYDLRFPVFSRNRADYDILLYVANWPASRSRIWSTLLSARAIENQCYVLGCNRVGEDANLLQYTGDSEILDFHGLPLVTLPPNTSGVLYAKLDLTALQLFRQQFPAALDADAFTLQG